MSRFLSTIIKDIRLQLRYGFYYAAVFVALLYIVILKTLSLEIVVIILPVVLLSNLTITAYFFVAGLLLFEKSEGTLDAIVVTPVCRGEYLWSKAVSLTILTLLEGLVIISAVIGFAYNPFRLILSLGFIAIMLVFIGFVVVARYDSINEFIIPGALLMTPLALPLIDYFNIWRSWLFYLHPLQAPLELMRGTFDSKQSTGLVWLIVLSVIWCIILFRWAGRNFDRHIIKGRVQ